MAAKGDFKRLLELLGNAQPMEAEKPASTPPPHGIVIHGPVIINHGDRQTVTLHGCRDCPTHPDPEHPCQPFTDWLKRR